MTGDIGQQVAGEDPARTCANGFGRANVFQIVHGDDFATEFTADVGPSKQHKNGGEADEYQYRVRPAWQQGNQRQIQWQVGERLDEFHQSLDQQVVDPAELGFLGLGLVGLGVMRRRSHRLGPYRPSPASIAPKMIRMGFMFGSPRFRDYRTMLVATESIWSLVWIARLFTS